MLGLHVGLPVGHWLSWPWTSAGAVLIVLGLVIEVVSDRQFKRHGTTVKPFQPSSALVTDGMFRLSRNPMYLGMVVILSGAAVWLGSVSPWVVPPVFVWWVTRSFISVEERMLEEQFGRRYLDYKASVRRWM